MPRTIITIVKGRDRFVFATLTKLCNSSPEFKYSHIKTKKFPFYYKGWEFTKNEVI